jgi:esterase/lipase
MMDDFLAELKRKADELERINDEADRKQQQVEQQIAAASQAKAEAEQKKNEASKKLEEATMRKIEELELSIANRNAIVEEEQRQLAIIHAETKALQAQTDELNNAHCQVIFFLKISRYAISFVLLCHTFSTNINVEIIT